METNGTQYPTDREFAAQGRDATRGMTLAEMLTEMDRLDRAAREHSTESPRTAFVVGAVADYVRRRKTFMKSKPEVGRAIAKMRFHMTNGIGQGCMGGDWFTATEPTIPADRGREAK